MTTFALVHGGFHGAWCWEQLSQLLQKDGHRVVTMDLPLEDSATTFDDYADVGARPSRTATTTWCSSGTPMRQHDPVGRRAPTGTASRLSVRDDPRRRAQPGRATGR